MAPTGSQHTKTKPHLLMSAGYLLSWDPPPPAPRPPPYRHENPVFNSKNKLQGKMNLLLIADHYFLLRIDPK